MQKGFTTILILAGIILIAAIASGAYYLEQAKVKQTTDETSGWKIYTNTKYGYSLKYPDNLPAHNGTATRKSDELVGMETTDSVIFGCSGFGEGVCLPPFEISKSSLEESQINDIFNLKIGGQTTREITYALGGGWGQKTDYTRLADQISDGIKFLVLDNPSGYGGSNRIWFAEKNGIILLAHCIYADENFLNVCQKILSSFQSTQ